MKTRLASSRRSRSASAIVLTLMAMALVTLLVLSFFLLSRTERTSSNMAFGKARSDLLADMAADVAVARLKEATEDGMADGKMWISEPGRIRVYNRAALNEVKDYNLFSARPGADAAVPDQNNVDLNKASLAGRHAISGTIPGTMKVGWINLPADPALAPSATNVIVGRIAYWVDDDSCKVNINTADGSKKDDLYRRLPPGEFCQSFGFGTPGEISLQALKDKEGAELSQPLAAAVSAYAWDKGFNSASEIGRVPGLPKDFFQANQFNITHYSKIPEINFFGEPRMYLMPVVRLADPFTNAKIQTTMLGGSGDYCSGLIGDTDASKKSISGPIDFVYPAGNQFSTFLVQYPSILGGGGNNACLDSTGNNKAFLTRMGNAINGVKSDGFTKFQWPAFNGVTSGFSDKYSLRQIDSIVLQIYDLCCSTVNVDQARGHSLPSIIPTGIINTGMDPEKSKSVVGIGRFLKLTEIYLMATLSPGTVNSQPVSRLQLQTNLEFYFPQGYEGAPLHDPYVKSSVVQFQNNNTMGGVGCPDFSGLNQPDMVKGNVQTGGTLLRSWLGSYWSDNMFRILDQADTPAGVDIAGNTSTLDDPDQAKAQQYHPYMLSGATYKGGVNIAQTRQFSMLQINGAFTGQAINPGTYHSQPNYYKTTYYPLKSGVTDLRFRGGFSFWNRTGAAQGGWNLWEPVPLDGLRGAFTGETADPSIMLPWLQQAVMPVNFNIPATTGAGAEYCQISVQDPLVNKFPGDWETVIDPPELAHLFPNTDGNGDPRIYKRGGFASLDPAFSVPLDTSSPSVKNRFVKDFEGDNPRMRPSGGGDPLSLWLPRIDLRYPKQSRFPSVGALNYIRTGMIPDDLTALLINQKGTPWRSINFSSSSALSQRVHNVSYPDWAMMDLFTVPYLPQKPYRVDLAQAATPIRKLTFGGATEGKLNINNPLVPYPFAEDPTINSTPPERTAPLEALFYGIKTAGGTAVNAYELDGTPRYTKVDHISLREAVQSYLSDPNKRFLLPGQLADVPEIQAITYSGVDEKARSRNDLMRQVLGNTTTQSNVYTIWVVAQNIRKNPANTNYGIFEEGDTVVGETRRRYTVERRLEFGKDGVPGNAVTGTGNGAGVDTIVGTADDVINATYNPMMTYPLPYRWRIISAENSTPY